MGNHGPVKLFLIGPACAGKTTLTRELRSVGLNAADLDNEIVRLNGGVWPDMEVKNTVVIPQALAEVQAMRDVVLLHSAFSPEETRALKKVGFSTALLDVSETELRRRHKLRYAEEGWSNEEWFDYQQSAIEALRQHGLFDHVISGEGDVVDVVADVMRLYARRGASHER